MLRNFFLHLIAEGNCASKFKVAAVAIRVFKNEAPKNQFNTGLKEYLEHWKMVSDDIGIEEPKLIRLANPNPLIPRLDFEGLEHLLPEGLLKASFLQKSGVTNAMENFLMEEQKNVNQNLKKLTNSTSGTEWIQNIDNPQKVIKFLPIYMDQIKTMVSNMSMDEDRKFNEGCMDQLTETMASNMSTQERLDQIKTMASNTSTQERLDQIKTMASNMSMDEIRAIGDQIKTMASNMSMDEIKAVGTEGAGGPMGPNRTGGPSRLNEAMASNMSMDENMGVDTGGARGPPMGAEGTGAWCNGVWFPTLGETIEDLDDFLNPSMDENQESNGPIMEPFLKNGASGSKVNQDLNPRKVSSTLPTQNLKSVDQITETMASSMSMGPKVIPKAIKKTKNVAMAGILRQAATRSPGAGVENRASGAIGAKGTRIIQDLNPQKVSSTLSIQERLDQIKTMASNMSMDENRAVSTEGASGPVGPKGPVVPKGPLGSSGILRQAETRSPSASVENKALGPGAASAADFAKRVKATPDFGLHLRLRDGD